MDTLSLIELKKLAKEKRIKQYYILPRAKLIELLTLNQLPQSYTIEKMTICQLRALAKERKMKGIWGISKKELTSRLFPAHDKQKNDGQTSEHEDPQEQNTNQIRIEDTE